MHTAAAAPAFKTSSPPTRPPRGVSLHRFVISLHSCSKPSLVYFVIRVACSEFAAYAYSNVMCWAGWQHREVPMS
jgi:hypothetical protein